MTLEDMLSAAKQRAAETKPFSGTNYIGRKAAWRERVEAAKEEVACLEDAIAALTEFVYVESHGEKDGE